MLKNKLVVCSWEDTEDELWGLEPPRGIIILETMEGKGKQYEQVKSY